MIEWECLEFKWDWNLVFVLCMFCVFVNDINNWGGGYIIIGVEEYEGWLVLLLEGVVFEWMDSI